MQKNDKTSENVNLKWQIEAVTLFCIKIIIIKANFSAPSIGKQQKLYSGKKQESQLRKKPTKSINHMTNPNSSNFNLHKN